MELKSENNKGYEVTKKMSLKEFRELSTDEICLRINQQAELQHGSSKEKMEQSGYDFSWTSMRNEALSRGLKDGFYAPTETGNKIIKEASDVQEITIILSAKEKGTRRCFTFESDDVDRIDFMTQNLKRTSDKSAVVAAMVHYALEVFEEAGKQGKVITIPPAGLCFDKENIENKDSGISYTDT